jgi:hypothetical protein
MATNEPRAGSPRPQPGPVKPQSFGLETQTELPEYSASYGATKVTPFALYTQEGGKGPVKGPGTQISGVVEGVEHKDGLTTIRYGAAGRSEAISFPSKHGEKSAPEVPNALEAVAEGVSAGDHFALRIGREVATLANDTKGLETKIQPDGRTEVRAIAPALERSQDRGLTRDAPG